MMVGTAIGVFGVTTGARIVWAEPKTACIAWRRMNCRPTTC